MLKFVNSRLSIGHRLSLVAGVFILASAISAVLLANYGMTNIAFSHKERIGTEYNALIWQALQQGRAEVSGHDAFDAQFRSAEAHAAFAKAKSWEDRVSTAMALILAVADGSNLTLDPDLDSYYAMDAATVKLPNLLAMSLRLKQALALPADTPKRSTTVAMALDRFGTSADAALSSIATSIKNNAAGLTETALAPSRDTLKRITEAMAAAGHADLAGQTADFAAAEKPFNAALDGAWRATNDELLRLLDLRLAGLRQGLIVNILVVLALIALSLLLTITVTSGLSRRFKALGEVMTRLNHGDKSVEVPYLDDCNETGSIAATLANMKQGLIKCEIDLQQREADRMAAADAQKQAEIEAQAKSEALVVDTFGTALKALAEERLSFRLEADLPPAYRVLKDDFNHAIAAFERNQDEREQTAVLREEERQQAAEAQKSAEDEAKRRAMEMVVTSFGTALRELATRNLVYRMDFDLPTDYRQLQDDFNSAMDEMSAAMYEIRANAGAIAASAAQISAASTDLSLRSERQAASLEETAAAVEQITATVCKSSENANTASGLAIDAQKDAERGNDIAKRTIQAMGRIALSSNKITSIIGVIDEIAFQTNLLALNAGVEAARAGDAGKGFAVVASEVRALAQRSADAAKEIKTLIKTSEHEVEGGVKMVEESGASLDRIVNDIHQITSLMSEIANSQKEQAAALGEVNAAVAHMDQATQQNAAMVEQSTAASKSLADDARGMSDLVSRFKTETDEVAQDCAA